MNAKDLKQSALVKKELTFLQNYNQVVYRLDELMELLAKELGETEIVLHKVYNTLYDRNINNENTYFFIDKKTYKTLKSYYKKKGFKVRKTMNKIIISWK